MLAMVILIYAISVMDEEAIRDVQYAQVAPDQISLLSIPKVDKRSRWFLYLGPFLLLKQRYRLHIQVLRRIVTATLLIFANLVFAANVRT
jgi:hypothetical protein